MKPSNFELVRPHTIEEALSTLVERQDDGAKLLAGGQSLIAMMNFRLAQPGVLVDIGRIPNLDTIEVRDGYVSIGSMARHADVMASSVVEAHLPLVREAYRYVAHPTIRNRGTLGGNLAHADPASEMPCVALVLDARFVLRSASAERTVPAGEFFFGPFMTAIQPTEMLVEIQFPMASKQERSAFEEVSLRQGDFAVSAVAVQLRTEREKCVSARIGIAGVEGVPVRASTAEDMLQGEPLTAARIHEACRAAVSAIDIGETETISADYRRHVTIALMDRALHRAAGK